VPPPAGRGSLDEEADPFANQAVRFSDPQHVQVSVGTGELEEILNSCELALSHQDSGLLSHSASLLNEFRKKPHGVDRQWIRQSVGELRLFRPTAAIEGKHLQSFYVELLGLTYADGAALRYQGYKYVVSQVAEQGITSAHAFAMLDAGLEGPARLLLLNSVNASGIRSDRERFLVPPADTIAMIIDKEEEVDDTDSGIVLHAALRNLRARDQISVNQRDSFKSAMYTQPLIAVLQGRYAADPQNLLNMLVEILIYAYGDTLSNQDANVIFTKLAQQPSAPLLGAMLKITHAKYHLDIIKLFAAYSIRRTELNTGTRDDLARLILPTKRRSPDNAQPDSGQPVYVARDFRISSHTSRGRILIAIGGLAFLLVFAYIALQVH
jgi:hypothetical protein